MGSVSPRVFAVAAEQAGAWADPKGVKTRFYRIARLCRHLIRARWPDRNGRASADTEVERGATVRASSGMEIRRAAENYTPSESRAARRTLTRAQGDREQGSAASLVID
jgi:hypothetical protein